MQHLSSSLEGTPGPLDVAALDDTRAALYRSLPGTLQGVLLHWNGAFFNGDLTFSTGVESRREDAAPTIGDDALVELWGFHPQATPSESDGVPHDLLAEADRHDEEAFLPRGLVAIGVGLQNSLVLVSVRPEDRGAVYYWEWYWRYPWNVGFFQERIDRAMSAFADPAAAAEDPGHPEHDAVIEAANEATVVRLHDDFGNWVLSMVPSSGGDE